MEFPNAGGRRTLSKMRALRALWQLHAMLWLAGLLGIALVAAYFVNGRQLSASWVLGAVVLLLPGWLYGGWRHAAYGAELLPSEGLVLRRGVWWRTESWVPIARLQHLDLHQSPLERFWGMARLILHTAGQHDHKTAVQGLPLAEAQSLREALMPKVQGRHE